MSQCLRVAIVGAGPAGAYAAGHLIDRVSGVAVDMIDRLPTPWGLVRAGVAPDHAQTKGVIRTFDWTSGSAGFAFHLNVEAGTDVSHAELLEHNHAVIYASGSPDSNSLGIPGEDLDGCCAATDFVGWYNGHPDFRHLSFDLSGERVVIIGNGNVALDVARILTSNIDSLRRTDIADHALEALAESAVREVVILGRRGPAQAAFTTPELIALADLSDVDVVIDSRNAVDPDQVLSSGSFGFAGRLKAGLVAELASREPRPGRKRIVLRFLASPTEVLGTAKVTGVRTTRNALVNDGERVRAVATDEAATIDTSLVLSSIGYRGRPVAGVPFDERSATIPNLAGRVLDGVDGRPVPGVYTTGWIKRGPSGVIGTNKQCSDETVQALLVDYYAGLLDEPVGDRAAFHALLDARVETRVDVRGWRAIDTHEREAGAPHGRPRVKMSTRGELLKVALTERN